jgi:K+ transporter
MFPELLALCEPYNLTFDMMETSFFLSRERLFLVWKVAWLRGANYYLLLCRVIRLRQRIFFKFLLTV